MDIITAIPEGGVLIPQWILIVVNFCIIGMAIIAIVLAILSKDKTVTKVLSVLFALVLPPIGSLFVFGRLLYLRLKKKEDINEVA